ncbi:hypothetical protein KCV07_g139, partial [Aureobasidium melanogenum]
MRSSALHNSAPVIKIFPSGEKASLQTSSWARSNTVQHSSRWFLEGGAPANLPVICVVNLDASVITNPDRQRAIVDVFGHAEANNLPSGENTTSEISGGGHVPDSQTLRTSND